MSLLLQPCSKHKTVGEYKECKSKIINQIKNEPYFFEAPLYELGKHFLSHFLDIDIWKADYDDIVSEYKKKFDDNTSLPSNRKLFYKYIAKEYLELDKSPKEELFQLYQRSSSDLIQIKATIIKLKKQKEKIETKKNTFGYLEVEDRYNIKHIDYYIAKNQQARENIIEFLSEDIKDVAYQDSKVKVQPLGLSFSSFGDKHYPYTRLNKRIFSFLNIYDIDYFSDLDNKMLKLDISTHDLIRELLKENKKDEVLEYLKVYISEHELIKTINDYTDNNHILNDRKEILTQIFIHLNNKDYISVNNMLPLQIEGLFHDFCLLIGINEKELNISSLNSKLDKLQKENSQISYFNYEYFSFRFPIIRNKVAHGRYLDSNDEFQANYLIYDLFSVCEMLTNKHIELNMYIDLINQTDISKCDFDNKHALIRFLNIELPDFYKNEKIKLEKIKQQYLKKPFLDKLEEYLSKAEKDALVHFKKRIGWLKRYCLEKKDTSLDYFFPKISLREKR